MEMRKIEKKLAFDVEAQKSSYECNHDCRHYAFAKSTATDWYNRQNGWGNNPACYIIATWYDAQTTTWW